jgi:hypothetical protein
MMKNLLIVLMILFWTGINIYSQEAKIYSQEAKILTLVLKDQKRAVRTKVNKKEKVYYKSLLSCASERRLDVLKKINNIESTFNLSKLHEFNIVEYYDIAHGNIYGFIWDNMQNGFIYSFTGNGLSVIVLNTENLERSPLLKNIFDLINSNKIIEIMENNISLDKEKTKFLYSKILSIESKKQWFIESYCLTDSPR